MIILTYLNKLMDSLYDENIPEIGRLALDVYIFCVILFFSYLNIMANLRILISLDNKSIQNWRNKFSFIKKVVNIYKKTRIEFLIFEIFLSLFIILFLLYYSYQIYIFHL
uniref:Uncharacterized protein n=1 Tax=Russula abietina TaxID=482377 RepID=A0A2S0U3Q1_9AGAM|nr:hypothetical protein [Russula abietina]AWB36122.1 hypothetical protein [Russula abietina]